MNEINTAYVLKFIAVLFMNRVIMLIFLRVLVLIKFNIFERSSILQGEQLPDQYYDIYIEKINSRMQFLTENIIHQK